MSWNVTRWEFDPASGVDTAKTYADGSRVAYAYTADGKRTRTAWVGGAWRQDAYSERNLLCGTTYSDAARRGVSVTLAYDGSHVTNVTYAMPNGSVFSVNLTRERARKELVTRRGYYFGGRPVYWYEVGYDILGRPTNAADSVSLARAWLYNRRSELAAASVGTNRYGYAYDTIGNRLRASANAATNSYTANSLNQYVSILCASASLREILPRYDADGNMMHDGMFAYAYDAENRLGAVTSAAETNGAVRVLNAYDHRHRRIRKTVQRLSVGVVPPPSPPAETRKWETTATHAFVWDGMNIVLERVAHADGTARTFEYFWGNDLSGTEEGAGGVGGLLAVSVDGAFHVPCYDHNGNVVLYVSETGSIAAQYVYDSYGNVVESSGTLTDAFTFGFSTKCRDRETGFVAYQRRFYSPCLGRWLNRDPIGEDGGENLYAFCGNSPVSKVDKDGCGVWNFDDVSPWGDSPSVTVSYTLDESERKCCKACTVLRYVRMFITGGRIGPYKLDGLPEQFVGIADKGYAPSDWPEGPGIGIPFADEPYYRFPWTWDFLFKAKCTDGPWAGKILGTRQRYYKATGHRQGDEDFEHGFY